MDDVTKSSTQKITDLQDNVKALADLFQEIKNEQYEAVFKLTTGIETFERGVNEASGNCIASLETENEELKRTLRFLKSREISTQFTLPTPPIHIEYAPRLQDGCGNYPQIQKLLSRRNYSYCCYENIRNAYEDDCTSSKLPTISSRNSSRRTPSTYE